MVGIFDSGFGGLTIFKEIYKLMPQYDYIYLGDNARYPYGNKSQELIYKFTAEAMDFLFAQKCELIVIACGTASTEALKKIQQEYLPKFHPDKKVLGIIRPLVEEAARVSRFGKIGVVGTRGTVQSKSYIVELEKQWDLIGRKENLQVFQQACPLLVPLVEEGWTKRKEAKMILRKYLKPLKDEKVDTLILGCTHYPVLFNQFRQVMPKMCNVLNSGEIAAKSLADYLERHKEIKNRLSKNETCKFFTTDNESQFDKFGKQYFGSEVKSQKVETSPPTPLQP